MDLQQRKWDFLYVLQTHMLAHLIKQVGLTDGLTPDRLTLWAARATELDPKSFEKAPARLDTCVFEFMLAIVADNYPEWAMFLSTEKPNAPQE